MTLLNRLYGILTDGDNAVRKTTVNRSGLTNLGEAIVKAILPLEDLSANGRRALAELYIRLCQTSPEVATRLEHVDPLNSYKLHSFTESFEDALDISTIVKAIRKLGLPDEENSFLPFDYILNALNQLLKTLETD